MIRATVDAIEDKVARLVFDDGSTCAFPAHHLPRGAREGDRITIELAVDEEETRSARERISRKRAGLSRDPDDNGDIKL